MDFQQIIDDRKAGRVHADGDLSFLAMGAAEGTVPDGQLIEWLRAAVAHPLSVGETASLTLAMARSGERLDLSSLPKPWVDKHSTGGVGDKTTIVLLPLLAACGLTMVKMSGRGLGITGGTIDKLESLPGFRTDLTPEEMISQAGRIGLALTGQTPRLAPADKVLYALRDASGTVKSMPLIASSVLSKKIAGGAETIVIDLKCGSGAFMKSLDEARGLADLMLQVAERCGIGLRIAITAMDEPLGMAVGNLLEVREAVRVLNGSLENRFKELCLDLAALALHACGRADAFATGRERAALAIESGGALNTFESWVRAQGCESEVGDGENWNPAPFVAPLQFPHDKMVAKIDAEAVGSLAMELGGGRKAKGDAIDHRVGVDLFVESGSQVSPGDPAALVYAADEASGQRALERLRQAFTFGEAEPKPLVIEVH